MLRARRDLQSRFSVSRFATAAYGTSRTFGSGAAQNYRNAVKAYQKHRYVVES